MNGVVGMSENRNEFLNRLAAVHVTDAAYRFHNCRHVDGIISPLPPPGPDVAAAGSAEPCTTVQSQEVQTCRCTHSAGCSVVVLGVESIPPLCILCKGEPSTAHLVKPMSFIDSVPLRQAGDYV